MNPDQIAEQIGKRVEEAGKLLFCAEPRAAVAQIDQAGKLAAQIEEEVGEFLRGYVSAFRNFALGMLAAGEDGDPEAALTHFEDALETVTSLREKFPKPMENTDLQTFAIGVEEQVLLQRIKSAAEPERAALQQRHEQIKRQRMGLLKEDSPWWHFFQAVEHFQKALAANGESSRFLAVLDLEEAARFMEEATHWISRAEQALGGFQAPYPFFAEIVGLWRGLAIMIKSREAYIRALRDAVTSQVRVRQLNELLDADRQLLDAESLIKGAIPALRRFGDTRAFALDDLNKAIDFQRESIRHLRRLVRGALTPREVTRRSLPRFAMSFVVVASALLLLAKASGQVHVLEGMPFVYLLLVCLLVSIISTFGFEAGINTLDKASAIFTGAKASE